MVHHCGAKLDLERIAKMILGKDDDKDRTFLAQIISSPYDADKLDYIARDSYYCGLALTVDLARFYGMISTVQHGGERILVLRNYVPLEQILFSKMTLFGSVYHHQKVKCLDSMLRSLVQHIVENADQCVMDIRGARITFADPVQYLYTTDDEFLNQFNGFGDEYTKKMLTRLRQRDLFVRCVEISRRTVNNWADHARLKHVKLATDPDKLNDIEKDIHKRLPPAVRGRSNVGDVRLSVPRLPSLSNDFAFVQTAPSGPVEKIEEFFPVGQWVDAYTHNKWRSYVYAPRELAEAVRDAAIESLKDRVALKIDVTKSNRACHLT